MIKKAEANALPLNPCEDGLPGYYIAAARPFFCSKGYDMLNVDISLNGRVVARYFADPVTREHKAHLIGKTWSTIKLKNIIQKAAGYKPRLTTDGWGEAWDLNRASWQWEERAGGASVAKCVLGMDLDDWENRIAAQTYKTRSERAYELMNERLDRLINPAPEGFVQWVADLLIVKFAIHETETGDGHIYSCTECGHMWEKKKARYRVNRTITCPECGEKLKVSNSYQTEHIGIYLFQKSNDGRWYERYIVAYNEWTQRPKEWNLKLIDQNLAILNKGARFGDHYYREGSGYSKSSHNGLLPRMGKGFIYPDFGGTEELMSRQQARCLRVMADRELYANANKLIMNEEDPGIEYLLKGRYDRLAVSRIDGMTYYKFNKNATDIAGYLRLNKQRSLRLRQIDGGELELTWLRYEQITGRKVSADDLKFFQEKHIATDRVWEMMEHISSPTQLRNYLEKQARMHGESIAWVIQTYGDYMRMAKEQKLNVDNAIFYKPKDLKTAHDACVRAAHAQEYEKRAAEVAKKFPKVEDVLNEIYGKYEYESGDYAIVVPRKIADIIEEGRCLGHCIDTTDRYFERIEQHVTYLVFLRKRSSKDSPWYTLEIEPGGTVRQQRTTGNRQNKEDTKAYMPFIREWQQAVRERISDEDRQAAERSRDLRLVEYKELRDKKETVRRGLLAGQLLADVLEADLVEAI